MQPDPTLVALGRALAEHLDGKLKAEGVPIAFTKSSDSVLSLLGEGVIVAVSAINGAVHVTKNGMEVTLGLDPGTGP